MFLILFHLYIFTCSPSSKVHALKLLFHACLLKCKIKKKFSMSLGIKIKIWPHLIYGRRQTDRQTADRQTADRQTDTRVLQCNPAS